jgi:hypothetical protein
MKVASKKNDGVENAEVINPEVIEAVTGTAMVPAQNNLPTNVIGQRTGEVGEARLQFPTLAIAYGVGKYAAKFSQGDLVLDNKNGEEYLLVSKNQPLIVTLVSERVYWKQYLSKEQRDMGLKPKNYATKEEAKAAGEVTDWPPWGTTGGPKPTVSRAGVFQMLIQKPKDLGCALFAFPMGGELWAPAQCFLDKNAFKLVDAGLSQALQFSLAARGGNMIAGRFALTMSVSVDKEKGRTNVVPSLRLVGGNSDKDLAEIVAAFTGRTLGEPDADEGSVE